MLKPFRLQLLRAAAVELYGDLGAWTYDTYTTFNELFFDGNLSLKGVQWGITPYSNSLGFYNPRLDSITLHQSLLEASSNGTGNPWGLGRKMGKSLSSDVLLHEMIHQWLYQQNYYKSNDDMHNSKPWCDELNRISQLLKLPYYYTHHIKITKRVPAKDPVISGKYCDLETRRVRKPPTKRTSMWVPVDKEAETKARQQNLILASYKYLLHFPYIARPSSYYNHEEQMLLTKILTSTTNKIV